MDSNFSKFAFIETAKTNCFFKILKNKEIAY
jgi:hypothetical protein